MCSIGGFISKEPLDGATALRLARALLWYGASRGRQSAGVWTNGRLLKRAQDPSMFIARDDLPALFDRPTGLALTHTRQPTCGGTGDEQAHPFHVGNVVTVHNGWLDEPKELKTKWGLDKPSGVDSELLASYIAKNGIDALPDFLQNVHGSSAIAAVLDEKDLYFMRDGGPIEFVRISVGSNVTLIFGSTETQVMSAARNVWLLPEFLHSTTVAQGVLFKVTHEGVEQLSEPIKYKSGYRGGSGYYGPHGGNSMGGGQQRWMENGGGGKYHQERAIVHKPAVSTPPTPPPPALPVHDNPRDARIQQQLGPNFRKVIINGVRTWKYEPQQADPPVKLSRRERRRAQREAQAAAAAAAADKDSSGGGAGSGVSRGPDSQEG